ncbi:MAG TPA: BrnT family toxin [Terriglobales bacterium]|nr:BrnT family toxin [Terriglobales bacterium]
MILFEWDSEKAQSNVRKHGVSFELARSVFLDEFALIEQDRIVDGEPRWRTIGFVGGRTVLFVAHTLEAKGEHEVVRIISARRATPTERRSYGENRKKHAG